MLQRQAPLASILEQMGKGLSELRKKEYICENIFWSVVTIQWRSMANTHCLKQVVKVSITSDVIWAYVPPDMIRRALPCCGILSVNS